MDADFYFASVDRMEKRGVNPDYIQGWIGGYMGNPPREEQRVTEAYQAGYQAGQGGEDSGFEAWILGDGGGA